MKKYRLLIFLIGLFLLAGCVTAKPAPQTWIPTLTTTLSPTPFASLTPIPATRMPAASPTPTASPTIAATLITPFVKGRSIGSYPWSPDSRWLPYVDFSAQTLHFYDTTRSTTCDFPVPIHNPNPDRFIAWLPDGRVVVQAVDKVMAGTPCGMFRPATAPDILVLDHQDPSFSPDGRYQVIMKPDPGSSQGLKMVIDLKDAVSGKNLVETVFINVPRGGGNLPGYWLDAAHFLIIFTGDQGPLLLTPGKPAVQVATNIFHLPLKPGSGTLDVWKARSIVTTHPPAFHLLLVGTASQTVENPLQIYHSETGQVETLPYLATQGSFSNDGHWLLVDQTMGQTLIRPLDPPGAPFQTFTEQGGSTYQWSPDGSKAYGMANLAANPSMISLYSSPQRTFLSAWHAPGYELFPSWSPDGKYLTVWARLVADPDQSAIFVILTPSATPPAPSSPQASSPTVRNPPTP